MSKKEARLPVWRGERRSPDWAQENGGRGFQLSGIFPQVSANIETMAKNSGATCEQTSNAGSVWGNQIRGSRGWRRNDVSILWCGRQDVFLRSGRGPLGNRDRVLPVSVEPQPLPCFSQEVAVRTGKKRPRLRWSG
ncbi:hypothetical protein HNY73_007367 [Argiope bruennichi]|uniref:Uncharacterized protein n=1 Tax=Argiope bruennichi TaxID=94029 RepID=A0A8T0FIS3_ARGBR|nr:hypothetical protein HNY73_007367 [Argiope bruennichi]